MEKVKSLLLVTAIFETVLSIPFLGGMLVVMSLWLVLALMLVLHIITLVSCAEANVNKTGSILGIVTSILGWVPFLGMIAHIVTAVLLWITYSKVSKTPSMTGVQDAEFK